MVEALDYKEFYESVLQEAHVIFYYSSTQQINHALPEKSGKGQGLKEFETVGDVLTRAREILSDSRVLEKLCPALASVGDKLSDICNTLVGVLVPLILLNQLEMSISAVIFGAISVVLMTSGVKSFCGKF